MGRELGEERLKAYLETKTVTVALGKATLTQCIRKRAIPE